MGQIPPLTNFQGLWPRIEGLDHYFICKERNLEMLALLWMDTAFLMEAGPQPKDPSARWTASSMPVGRGVGGERKEGKKKNLSQRTTLPAQAFLSRQFVSNSGRTGISGPRSTPPPIGTQKEVTPRTPGRAQKIKMSITSATFGDTPTSHSTDCPGHSTSSLVVGS